ncbi:MAG: ATP-binding cassette domain-containing protein [Clostridiales bacterium]|nr:ATP-binding cassette domain-containing protein [Clostridiales bacterium]
MIDIRNVSKRYGTVYALRDVSLSVEKGTVLGLLGQNGAGKTTLLNILTGYLAPTSGSVLLDGRDVLLEPEEARRQLGYLPEVPPLYDEMTVQEYLRYAAELRNVEKRSIPGHVDEVMELCGLTSMRHRLLSHLSKGYRQRAGFAQALCGDPEVLVLDEPTVGLDPKQIVEIRSLIMKMGKGRTIVFSSHILSEVQQLCDRVVILHDGVVKTSLNLKEQGAQENGNVTLLATVGAAEKSILPRVKALDGVVKAEVQPGRHVDQTTMLITFHGLTEPERRLFALLSGLNVPILHLSRQNGNLEQLFLRAISE